MQLKVEKKIGERTLFLLEDKKQGEVITIWSNHQAIVVEEILQADFSKNYCGMIPKTSNETMYVLLAPQNEEWKGRTGEWAVRNGETLYYSKNIPIESKVIKSKLVNAFTLLVYSLGESGAIKSEFHLYNIDGQKTIYQEIKTEESKYKKFW